MNPNKWNLILSLNFKINVFVIIHAYISLGFQFKKRFRQLKNILYLPDPLEQGNVDRLWDLSILQRGYLRGNGTDSPLVPSVYLGSFQKFSISESLYLIASAKSISACLFNFSVGLEIAMTMSLIVMEVNKNVKSWCMPRDIQPWCTVFKSRIFR